MDFKAGECCLLAEKVKTSCSLSNLLLVKLEKYSAEQLKLETDKRERQTERERKKLSYSVK